MDNVTHEPGDSIDMQNVAESALEDIQPGRIIKGEIVTIDQGFAYVNVGTKSDGRIPIEEFAEKPRVGDVVNVVMHSKKLVDGMYQFSKKAADDENPYVMGVANGTSSVAITFNVLWSNSYLVSYVTEEQGGIDVGTHAITNPVPPIFSGKGGIGSTTTIWDNVSSATNRARYYLIRCQ